MHVHLPPTPPFNPAPPPHLLKKKKKKKKKEDFCQIRIPCRSKKIGFFVKKIHLPLSPPLAQTTHTSPNPAHFFLIWIICQLDSGLVIILQIDKDSKSKIIFFFFFFFFWGGGGGGGGCGVGGCEHNVQCFKWHLYSSMNTNLPNYSEIHA